MIDILNEKLRWGTVFALLTAMGCGFLVVYAIANNYYGVFGGFIALYVWDRYVKERQLKSIEGELNEIKKKLK